MTTVAISHPSIPAIPWQHEASEGGVQLYYRSTGVENLHDFKAVSQMPASIDAILAVVQDTPAFPEWFYPCKEIRSVGKVSDGHRVLYLVWKAPWPTTDRDEVVDVKISRDLEAKRATVRMKLADQRLVPPTRARVRMTSMTGTLHLEEVAPGETRVVYSFCVNIGGSVGGALARMYLRKHPLRALAGLAEEASRRQTARPGPRR